MLLEEESVCTKLLVTLAPIIYLEYLSMPPRQEVEVARLQ
jgi:hypothetical protein